MTADNDALRLAAQDVLDANWTGSSTKPAPQLYPHQWSWDSAFIAIGNGHRNLDRAITELRSLFAAQWDTGMIPHIAFRHRADDDTVDYVPSPAMWATNAVAAAPNGIATSGICQPPVHAIAVGRLIRYAGADGRRLAEEFYEPLVAWHDYLHRYRARSSPLVEIWHPWESGMDNSPAWDGILATIDPDPRQIPTYVRVDTNVVDAHDRPTDVDYDRYTYLVELLRQADYLPSSVDGLPFRVADVLFNAVLIAAERDLAAIAERIECDPTPHIEAAASLTTALESLWDEEQGTYLSADLVRNQPLAIPIAGGFGALLATSLPDDRVDRVVATMSDRFLQPVSNSAGVLLPTVPLDSAEFEPTRYWRGPAWISVMWLVAEGLAAHNRQAQANNLRQGIVSLARTAGFHEYFDPVRSEGRGSAQFSWTAALMLDVIERFGPEIS